MRTALTQIRPRRSLTWLGRAVLSTIFFCICVAFFRTIYPFLAPDAPPHQGIMVVEGWMEDRTLEQALSLFNQGNYTYIASTGVQIAIGSHLVSWHTYAEMTTARLHQLGIPAERIITASNLSAQRDRTYTAALALRNELKKQNITEKNIHLITTGPHGRRSRLLFQKALGDEYHVGITCLEDPSYSPDTWWKCSNGVRRVIDEFIGYLYARFLFHPEQRA